MNPESERRDAALGGASALCLACVHGHAKVVCYLTSSRALTEAGVDINAVDRVGRTVLHYAATRPRPGGNLRVFRVLLRRCPALQPQCLDRQAHAQSYVHRGGGGGGSHCLGNGQTTPQEPPPGGNRGPVRSSQALARIPAAPACWWSACWQTSLAARGEGEAAAALVTDDPRAVARRGIVARLEPQNLREVLEILA